MIKEEEEEEGGEITLTKMNKNLSRLISKNPKYYDVEEDDDSGADALEEEEEEEGEEGEEEASNEEPTTQQANINDKVNKIAESRKIAHSKQTNQAEQMLSRNKKAINALNEDDIVLYKADDVDLGAADAPNIVCIILEKKDTMFKLGHKSGVLKELFPWNVLQKI